MDHASASFTSALPAVDDPSKETVKKKKEKTTPAKKSKQAKHKLAATAIGKMTATTTTTAVAPTATISSTAATPNVAADANLNSATDMEIENKTVTITPVDTKPSESSNLKAPTNNNQEQKSKKPRVRKPRRNIPKQKNFIPETEQPTENDVVGGRGGRSNHHPGNRPYWIRILESRNEYIKSRSDHEKARIADGILRYVMEELRGRFLNIDSKTKRWYTLPNSVVLDKIKQALRDKYIPYWARDLKIEDKKYEPLESILGLTKAVIGNNIMHHNIENNRPQHMPHHMPQHMPLHSTLPFANMHDPHAVHPSVALAEMEAARAKAANAMAAAATSRANAAAAAAKAATEAANAAAAAIPNGVNPANKSKNKLDFLFGRSARRPMGQTSAIPTVDDILKCKVDQMAAFRSMTTNAGIMAAAMANATGPPIPSLGMNPFNSVGVRSAWMASLGLGNSLGGGGMMGETMNNPAYAVGGDMGAPALPGPSSTLPASLGALHSVTMRSLDKYLEEKLAEKIAGVPAASLGSPASPAFTAANLPSLSRLNALAGTSFDSAVSSDPAAAGAVAAVPAASKKTDWNAMYTRALTNSKAV
jgi:hypothetical protein